MSIQYKVTHFVTEKWKYVFRHNILEIKMESMHAWNITNTSDAFFGACSVLYSDINFTQFSKLEMAQFMYVFLAWRIQKPLSLSSASSSIWASTPMVILIQFFNPKASPAKQNIPHKWIHLSIRTHININVSWFHFALPGRNTRFSSLASFTQKSVSSLISSNNESSSFVYSKWKWIHQV